ncbi:MAG: CocE/NonD family hydrolase [Pseudotabrizicola sp.]|uniref:CocE/NonD family hydrolase n=1 Tax=Pseudotabrizicola sp. TaxID=2939647 RepID=UPI002719F900|nr:CocE/NonD family hydrolase [Pseudotabrizicola sp.]MDO9638281.1 CocE/NonD family hydrolase [Pseudotabrizicola sp.]
MNLQVALSPAELVEDGIVVHRNVMIPMRDGVHLATDIYRPAKGGHPVETPLPVIFERTPYDKSGTPRTELSVARPTAYSRPELARLLVREGYVVIWQDCRGRYGSEGTFTKYVNEAEDGYDSMVWIDAQPWTNSRIGTMGLSYDAHVQIALACLNPPGLACMAVDSGGFSNAFTCGIRQGGALEMKQVTWAYNRAMESPLAAADPAILRAIEAEDLAGWMTRTPWTKGRSPVKWDPDYEAYLLDQWLHGTFDDFWKKTGLWAAGHYASFPKVPIIFMSSWYDAYVQTTLENYTGLKGDAERPLSLIMGPWTHGDRSERVFGDVDFGAAAVFDGQVDSDWLAYRLKFFARWLKDEPERVLDGRVHLFVMGGGSGGKTPAGHLDHGGRWIETTDWPVPDAMPMTLHMRADMSLGDVPGTQAVLSYDYDPRNPVPTIGGSLTSGEPIFAGGGFDQVEAEGIFGCTMPGMPLTARPDVLSFETAPLEKDMVIVGPVTVRLRVSTDAPDTDFTAKLVDVYPPCADYPRGYALNITDGIFRVRYRKGFDAPAPVAVDEGAFDITITPFATANRFARGHRLRLDISSSNFPKYDINPNTGEPEGTSRRTRIAVNSLYLGEGQVSCIELMILPDPAG